MKQGRRNGSIRRRTAAWLAWSLAALTVVLVCCEVAFAILYRASLDELPFLVGVVVSALVGAVVASRRPRNPIGWFFILSSLSFAIATGSGTPSTASSSPPTRCRWLMQWPGRIVGCGCRGLLWFSSSYRFIFRTGAFSRQDGVPSCGWLSSSP
jgi:hypothetical protein